MYDEYAVRVCGEEGVLRLKNGFLRYFLKTRAKQCKKKKWACPIRRRQLALGIAAGYLNLSSTMMGYSTGCCTCFNEAGVQKALGTNKNVHLLMGVGIADESKPRREKHDDPDFIYPTYKKHLDAVRVA